MSEHHRSLPVRSSTLLSEEGASTSRLGVYCPRQERTLPIADCARCEHGDGMEPDPERDGDAVRCRWATTAPPRPTIGEHMSGEVFVVREDASIDALRASFAERGVSTAPVVDAEGRLLGAVSSSDVAHAPPDARTVADVMAEPAVALSESASLFQASALMAYEGVHRIVVVDERWRVIGVLSALDVLAWIARERGFVLPPRR